MTLKTLQALQALQAQLAEVKTATVEALKIVEKALESLSKAEEKK